MLKTLARYVRRLLGFADTGALLAEVDVGRGSRLSISNLDGMFPRLVHIGRNCIFAPTSMVLTHDASYYLFAEEYRVAPVWIGDNVFVGYGAIIMPGTRIGSNVVIGAGSVVTRDVPDNSVAAGVPARVVCSLDKYLEARKRHVMCKPPYAGKSPREMTSEDVDGFRRVVYGSHGLTDPPAPP